MKPSLRTCPAHHSGLCVLVHVKARDLCLEDCLVLVQVSRLLSVKTVSQACIGKTSSEQIAGMKAHNFGNVFKFTKRYKSVMLLLIFLVIKPILRCLLL